MLTAAQLKARQGKLTASRVAPLMRGDPAALDHLYRVMIGEAQEEDLSDNLPVQLGSFTEPFNLDWYEKSTGHPVSRRGEVVVHHQHHWAACTLDGWDDIRSCPIECKHVGGNEPVETIIERYQPQMHWQMINTDAEQCALSLLISNNRHIVEYIPRDDEYGLELWRRGAQFMEFVRRLIPPVILPPAPPPIDPNKVYDMTGNNFWSSQADVWLRNRVPADMAKMAERALKEVVPADAKKCTGHGVRITRDRAGRLSLRPE